MEWIKLGRVFEPQSLYPWMQSHAANPVARKVDGSEYEVFFSCRDKDNRSSIASVRIDIDHPGEWKDLSAEPLLSPGDPGFFDDCGVSMGCLLPMDDQLYMYFLGWNLSANVPWRNSIGLAIRQGTGAFKKYSLAPVLDRNDKDPISLSYPWVMQDEGIFKMWYGSNLRWGEEQRSMDHIIKYAESDDGIHWRPSGEISINSENSNEYAFSKPCVHVEQGVYKMWYSFRGESYRIGYAESSDGIHFQRKDSQVGISPSTEGWDSETVEYPFVFFHEGEKYMLYNGNSFGKTGFGLARWEGE